jgi:hypothetical protein
MCDIKLWPISFLEIDLASTPIERASSMYRKTYLCSFTLDGRSHPDIWISRTGFRSHVIPEVSSRGLSP